MRIAVTADNHLTTREKHPERFLALENIYLQCAEKDVQLLVIAGDLFDQSLANYHEFEELHQKLRPPDLTTVIIPGNHDSSLRPGSLQGEGLIVYSEPTIHPLNDSRKVFFLPYSAENTMGEIIAQYQEELNGERWILFSHGDWLGGKNIPDPYEPGVYMPLSRKDVQLFNPELVFLGHIHLPQIDQKIHYPGSPCPIDVSETGIRSFIILDTDKGEVRSHSVVSQLIYFDETFTLLPIDNGITSLLNSIKSRIQGWDIPSDWQPYVRVRVSILGVSDLDRQAIFDQTSQAFAAYQFVLGTGPDLSNLYLDTDPDRAEISTLFSEWVNNIDWPDAKHDFPSKDQITLEAFKIIYGIE